VRAVAKALALADGLPRGVKRVVIFGYDLFAVCAAYLLGYLMRTATLDGAFDPGWWQVLGLTGASTLVAFRVLGLHHELLRFAGERSLRALAIGAIASSILLLGSLFALRYNAPRTLPLLYALALFWLAGAPRFAVRMMQTRVERRAGESVAIYGAGVGGRQLAAWLRKNPAFRVECFVDDDPTLLGLYILDVKVRAPTELQRLAQSGRCKRVLLAIPSLSSTRRREILAMLERIGLSVHTVPPFEDLVEGRAHIGEIRELDIEDLLPRPPIQPNEALLASAVRGKRVLVTGAGGSVGSELCRQIALQSPLELTMLDHGEFNLYSIDAELAPRFGPGSGMRLHSVLGSVLDERLLARTFERARPQVVFHAAAYKHVPLVEANIVEGVRNNVLGTRAVAEAARAVGVEHVILVSTDKAVRPTNVMGASKRMAELVLHLQSLDPGRTVFSMVRFGNVLGSSGSVVPLFRRQIALGGPVTVTHPEVTRFFMTIREAAQLVIQSVTLARGGEVFILDMGEPVRIADLARRMVHLSGKRLSAEDPVEGIEIQYTGLRPGEKLYEELLIGDAASGTEHPLIMRAHESGIREGEFRALLGELENACVRHDAAAVRQVLVRAGTGLSPQGAPAAAAADRVVRLAPPPSSTGHAA